MNPATSHRLKIWLKRKISFRLHMSFIMLGTIFFGIVSNYLLLNLLALKWPVYRYPLTVILSYAWFLFFLRIYIKNILFKNAPSNLDALDVADVGINSTSSTPVDPCKPQVTDWRGGGGSFQGGGASGSWDTVQTTEIMPEQSLGSEVGSNIVSGVLDDEGGAIVVLVIGGILAAVVFGSGAYLIWHSPEILSECLLQIFLVTGIRKNLHKYSNSDWLGHIFKVTAIPFVIVFLVSFFAGAYLHSKCPEASSLREAKSVCFST